VGVAETHEKLQFSQGESVAQHYLAALSMPSGRKSSLVGTVGNGPALQRPSQDGPRSSSHIAADRKTDRGDASTQPDQLFSTNRPDFDMAHGEGGEAVTHDCHPGTTTCIQTSPILRHDNVLKAQKLQDEQDYSSKFGEDAHSRFMTAEGVLRGAENGFTMTVSVTESLDPGLPVSRMMDGSNRPDGQAVTLTEGSGHSRMPDTSSMSGTVMPQVSNEIYAIAPPTARGVEQHAYLRPIPSQSGSACDAPGCTEVFRFARDLNYHLMKVHKRSQHTCHVEGCGKMFRDPTRLRHHIRTHSDKKAYNVHPPVPGIHLCQNTSSWIRSVLVIRAIPR
jgi:hypothetical protein